VDDQAQTGERWIIITDANCSMASFPIEVRAPQEEEPKDKGAKPSPGNPRRKRNPK